MPAHNSFFSPFLKQGGVGDATAKTLLSAYVKEAAALGG